MPLCHIHNYRYGYLAFKDKDELHTINGPNKLLQIRTKASKVKGSYTPLIFRGHQLKNKYMAKNKTSRIH